MKHKRLSQVRIGDTILDRQGIPFKVERITVYRNQHGRIPGYSSTWYDIDGTMIHKDWPGMVIRPALINGKPITVQVEE